MKKALKIYISVDMEGMAGITSPSQERDEVPSFRRALHNQVRWIIEGIHASSRNDEIGEITISVRNKSVQEVMEEILRPTGFSYTFQNDIIVITPKMAEPEKNILTGLVFDENKQPKYQAKNIRAFS